MTETAKAVNTKDKYEIRRHYINQGIPVYPERICREFRRKYRNFSIIKKTKPLFGIYSMFIAKLIFQACAKDNADSMKDRKEKNKTYMLKLGRMNTALAKSPYAKFFGIDRVIGGGSVYHKAKYLVTPSKKSRSAAARAAAKAASKAAGEDVDMKDEDEAEAEAEAEAEDEQEQEQDPEADEN